MPALWYWAGVGISMWRNFLNFISSKYLANAVTGIESSAIFVIITAALTMVSIKLSWTPWLSLSSFVWFSFNLLLGLFFIRDVRRLNINPQPKCPFCGLPFSVTEFYCEKCKKRFPK